MATVKAAAIVAYGEPDHVCVKLQADVNSLGSRVLDCVSDGFLPDAQQVAFDVVVKLAKGPGDLKLGLYSGLGGQAPRAV